jgi:hypothetical protein
MYVTARGLVCAEIKPASKACSPPEARLVEMKRLGGWGAVDGGEQAGVLGRSALAAHFLGGILIGGFLTVEVVVGFGFGALGLVTVGFGAGVVVVGVGFGAGVVAVGFGAPTPGWLGGGGVSAGLGVSAGVSAGGGVSAGAPGSPATVVGGGTEIGGGGSSPPELRSKKNAVRPPPMASTPRSPSTMPRPEPPALAAVRGATASGGGAPYGELP